MTGGNNWEGAYDGVTSGDIAGRKNEEYNQVGHFKTVPARVEDLLERLESSSSFRDGHIRMGGKGPMDPSAEREEIRNLDEIPESLPDDILKDFSTLFLGTKNLGHSNPQHTNTPKGFINLNRTNVTLPFPSYHCKVKTYGYEGHPAQEGFEEISKEIRPQKLNVLQGGKECDLVKFHLFDIDGAREDIAEGIENNREEIYLLSITEDGDTEIVHGPASEDFEGISEQGRTRLYGSRGEGSDRVLYEVLTKRPQATEEITIGIMGGNDNFSYIKQNIIEGYLDGRDGSENKSKGRLPEDLDEVMLRV